MDLNQSKKLAKDKIISDELTCLVRRNIKRKERERQQKREDFREEFGELLESQDLSNETQKLILEELRNIKNDENVDENLVLKPKRLRKRPKRIRLVILAVAVKKFHLMKWIYQNNVFVCQTFYIEEQKILETEFKIEYTLP